MLEKTPQPFGVPSPRSQTAQALTPPVLFCLFTTVPARGVIAARPSVAARSLRPIAVAARPSVRVPQRKMRNLREAKRAGKAGSGNSGPYRPGIPKKNLWSPCPRARPPLTPWGKAAPARARAGHSRRGWQVLGRSHGRPRAQPLRSPAGWPPPSFRSIHRDWPHRKQRPAPVAAPALLLRSALRSHYRSWPPQACTHHDAQATRALGPPRCSPPGVRET